MDRVVVDTNVIISALIGKGNPRKVLDIIFSDKVTFCVSALVLAEYENVLQRPKFSRYPNFALYASSTLKSLHGIAELVEPQTTIRVCSDPDDDKFLELALDAQAQYLITGNKRHFPNGSYKNIQIVSPKEFVSLFK